MKILLCRLFLASSATLLWSGFLVAANLTGKTPEQFILTERPQEAVFLIASGWTGGMGSMPVLGGHSGRPKEFRGLPIYLDEAVHDAVIRKLPSCFSGQPVIMVRARIQLERRTDVNTSIESQPSQSYYSARVLELQDVFVEARKCE